MQPWKASDGRPPKLTEEERRRRNRERKRATASSRWLAPPAAIPSTCKQRNPIKNPMELLEELPADLVLYIAEFQSSPRREEHRYFGGKRKERATRTSEPRWSLGREPRARCIC